MVKSNTIPVKPESEVQKPKLVYNNKTYQSYLDIGFDEYYIPRSIKAPEQRKREFLSRVDPSKGIARKITLIQRIRGADKKEYITYSEDWYGKNWLGQKISPVRENIEGIWMEQEKEPDIKQTDNGPEIAGYKKSGEHPVYDIEFSKENVDKVIQETGSDKDSIIFLIKIAPRSDYFTYYEFVNYSWDQIENILMQDGGAAAIRAFKKGQVLTSNKLDFKPS